MVSLNEFKCESYRKKHNKKKKKKKKREEKGKRRTSKVVLFVRAKVRERKESFHDNAISKTKDYEKQQTLNYNKNTLI
jgi:hypothetical protein